MVVAKKHHELYEVLASIVGTKYVSDDHAVLLSYTRDISTFPPGKPQGAVVRPGCLEEVVELVRLANQTHTPLIPMGGKASVSGVPPGQPGRGIIVDMKRMDKVIEIDEVNMAATAQCGITYGELYARCNEKGFGIHTAGMPHYVDTIGGHLSGTPYGGFGLYSTSIGYHGPYVLGIKVVLPNGSVVDTGTGEGSINTYRGHTWARAMNGPDLTGMFIGDGGIFGIKVEATYRMFRLPKFEKNGARCWDTLDEAYQAYYELWEIDPSLYMQPYALGLILSPEIMGFVTMGATEPSWTLFFNVIGNSKEEVELKFKTTDEFLARAGGRPGGPATATFGATYITMMRNMGFASTTGQFPLFELIVSRRDHLEAYKWTREFVERGLKEKGIDETKMGPRLGAIVASGPGYGMTSIIPTFNPSDREIHGKIHELLEEFLQEGARRGYVIEVTQGHESRLKAKQWTPEFYNYVLTLKKTLDPNNIMNPGVYFL